MALQKQVREELIVDAWHFENASQMIKDNNVDRIGKIQQHPTAQRICEGMWLSSAEVLAQNNIQYENFASTIKNALILGCRKETNILLYGPADCDKTFFVESGLQNLAKYLFKSGKLHIWLDGCGKFKFDFPEQLKTEMPRKQAR